MMCRAIFLSYAEEVASFGYIVEWTEVHLVEVLNADAVLLSDGVHRFARTDMVPVVLRIEVAVGIFLFLLQEYWCAGRREEVF